MDKKKILIVEDNDLNLKLFDDLLESNGYANFHTRDGALALEMAQSIRPDLIVMDIQLPNISGVDIIKNIKNDDDLKNIPILAVTAFALQEDEAMIREAGCDDYLAKPISIDSFLEKVSKCLEDN